MKHRSGDGFPWWYAVVGIVLAGLLPLGVFDQVVRFGGELPVGVDVLILDAFFVAVAVCLARTQGPITRTTFALRPMSITPGRAGLWMVLGMIGVTVAVAIYLAIIGPGHRPVVYWPTLEETETWTIVLGAVVAAPITEELFFRGFVHRALRSRLSMWPAVVLSATIFGLAHWWYSDPIAAVFPRVAAGVVLALLLERTGSLYPGIVLHVCVNLSVVSWAFPEWHGQHLLVLPIAWGIAILMSIHDPRRKRPRPPVATASQPRSLIDGPEALRHL